MRHYSAFARVYDRVMSVVPYGEWADYLQMVWERFSYKPEMILDLACGTGSLSLILAERGYQVTGLDASGEMIAQARRKAERFSSDVDFYVADMRGFELEKRFDCVVSLFDSINYLLDEEDLLSTFFAVSRCLMEQGYFIFDLNTLSRIRQIKDDTRLYEQDEFIVFWKNSTIPCADLWKVELTIFFAEDDGLFRQYREVHLERGYRIEVVKGLLKRAGFNLVDIFHAFTFDEGGEGADRLYVIARKAG